MIAPAVVIPISPGHEKNLHACLHALGRQTLPPSAVVVVAHRFSLTGYMDLEKIVGMGVPCTLAKAHDHQSPRNVGVDILTRDLGGYGLTHVAFLDSDIVVEPRWLECLADTAFTESADVVAGPYEFLQENENPFNPETRNDTRWPLFNLDRAMKASPCRYGPWRGDITRGLALYGGNLLWDLAEFQRLGGFNPGLIRGEDGELGIRATRHGTCMAFDGRARGYHQWHRVDVPAILERNRQDLPKIWQIHGDYLQAHGIEMVPEDGMRLNIGDTEGWFDNTALMWEREITRPTGVQWIHP